MPLPKILHRIWVDGSPPMPDEFVEHGEQWEKLHPDWEHKLWTQPSGRLSNQVLWDDAKRHAPNDWLRFRADVLRLEILFQHGGVYVDTDVEPLKPIDSLLEDLSAFAAWSPNRYQGRKVLTQAVIGAEPMHPFFHWCIADLKHHVKENRRKPLAQMTGPHFIDRVHREHDTNLHVFDAGVFYPQSNLDRNKGLKPDLSRAFTHHKWANSRKRAR